MVSELNWTTKTVKTVNLGRLGPKNAKTSISDCLSDQTQILRPLYNINYTRITIIKWPQILILTTEKWISSNTK